MDIALQIVMMCSLSLLIYNTVILTAFAPLHNSTSFRADYSFAGKFVKIIKVRPYLLLFVQSMDVGDGLSTNKEQIKLVVYEGH